MNLKTIFFIFVFFFLIISNVSAQPFNPDIQISVGELNGLDIKYPIINPLEEDKDYVFNFHIFNKSNGLSIISNITCVFHVYNESGGHIIDDMPFTLDHTYDFEYNIKGGNFSNSGDYAFLFQCNTTSLGGFVAQKFSVTPNGEEPSLPKTLMYLAFIFVLIIIVIICIACIVRKYQSAFEPAIKMAYILFIHMLSIFIMFLSWQICLDHLTSAPFLTALFRILFWILIALFFPAIIGGLVYIMYVMYKVREVQGWIKRGIGLR